MSNIRLFHPENITENTTGLLSKEHTHYVANVMRMKRGSNINFFNKEGEWLSEIIFLDRDRVEVKFLNKMKESSKPSNIELAICLVKKNPMEIILQKATELGVSRITPIISERTEVKELNYERAQKIVIEATEQSNQLNPPEVTKVIKLKDFLEKLDSGSKFLFADVNSQNNLQKKDVDGDALKIILIGPEGDFSPGERESILAKANTTSFSISKNILRSDTAVISAISLVNFINNLH
ncbi:16S rRNA (uracil(1498)-N(3))-methyltransferase [Pelagibacteraceae bacterium]|nr:16S rRNA (uracil(1498)-N(3))-methyltransferase [Pelagibacteraceae bacterium]MDC0366040.1 16S rRNA (uracil(1498)-N(3))-methyltransferase [Pelagibacteraceae bacterium]